MIDLRRRFDYRRGAVYVRALDRADAFRERLARQTTVRRGAQHRSKIDMTGGRKKDDTVATAACILLAYYRTVKRFKNIRKLRIGILIVVPVLWRIVYQGKPQAFMLLKILRQSPAKLL